MNKKRNIFKPDWGPIIQNIYSNAIWWILGIFVLVVWATLSKFEPLKIIDEMNPIYAYLLYLLMALGAALVIYTILNIFKRILSKNKKEIITLHNTINQSFLTRTILLDGKYFIDCSFENCKLRWNGGPFILQNFKIAGRVEFESENKIIVDTVDILKALGFFKRRFRKLLASPTKGIFSCGIRIDEISKPR